VTEPVELPAPAGFDWGRLLEVASRGGLDWVNRLDGESYVRLFTAGSAHVLVCCRMTGQRLRLDFETFGESPPGPPSVGRIVDIIRHTFALDESWPKARSALCRDQVLAPHADALVDFRPVRTPSLFEALVDALLGQQVHRTLAQRLRNRLVEDFGASRRHGDETCYAFPTPDRLARASEALLRQAGLSAFKATSLRALSGRFCRPLTLPDATDPALARLLRLPGIGPWSAEYALMQARGANDLVLAGDAFLQARVGRLYGLTGAFGEAEVRRIAEAWRPYRSWGTHLVWYALSEATVGSDGA
jgi:DNA-3-methyladenine glycosylase II